MDNKQVDDMEPTDRRASSLDGSSSESSEEHSSDNDRAAKQQTEASDKNKEEWSDNQDTSTNVKKLEGHSHHAPGEGTTNGNSSVCAMIIETIKYVYSTALLIFCIIIVMAAIFEEQTVGTADTGIHPIAAFFIFWFLIVWLGMIEGGQGALVGLKPINKDKYAKTHPRALKCTTLSHKGDNMERFIVGRQFLVVLILFVVNLMASATKGASVLGFPDLINEIFLASGVALILTTIMVGQLTAQVNATECMLDFINNYFMLFSCYVSLGIEMSGLLHFTYLVQIFFSKISGTPIESHEPPRNCIMTALFWGRVVLSCGILGFSFAVVFTALFDGKTTMYAGVPEFVAVIIFFILIAIVGMMEGMQIALFAVVNLPAEQLQHSRMAAKTCELTFKGTNLQAFLIGRQIFVTLCMFIVARIITIDVDTSTDDSNNIWGLSDGAQTFFNTGILGAIITTLVGSLCWRIIASSFPVAFLSNPLVYVIIRICLVIEATGICSASWLLALIQKKIVRYQLDEYYIGTQKEQEVAKTEERKSLLNRRKSINFQADNYKREFAARIIENISTAAGTSTHDSLTPDALKEAFKRVDTDNSGEISKEEMWSFMGDKLSEKDFNVMFDAIDLDGSGEVDYDEFCAFISKIRTEYDEEANANANAAVVNQ